MDIKNISINEIKPYENNPRINDNAIDKVMASIKEFGFKVPIVIDKDMVIVAGHTRYKAAEKLGLSEVPCIIADDLSPDQIKAFRLADNKVSEFSTWDFELLEKEMSELDFDFEEFGFSKLHVTEDFDDENDFKDDGFKKDEDELSGAKVRVGEYSFDLTNEEYHTLIEDVQLKSGFTKNEIVEELKKRLCNL